MAELAREAGVSVGLPYRYFAGRAELLVAVLAHVASGGERYRRREVPALDDPRRALGHALVSEITDDPADVRTGRVWSELYAESLFDAALRERLLRVRLSDAEARTWGITELFLVIVAVGTLLLLTTPPPPSAGTIYAALAYLFTFIEGLDTVPHAVARSIQAHDVAARLKSGSTPAAS